MRRSDKSDSVYACGEDLPYLIKKYFKICTGSVFCNGMTDFVILAINTSEIASFEKNVANPFLTAY